MCRTKSAEETIRFRTWKAYAHKRRFCGYCATLREPEILYPTMVFNKADILEMTPLTMQQPWLSPQSISNWPR
jgi:hypothetical protein